METGRDQLIKGLAREFHDLYFGNLNALYLESTGKGLPGTEWDSGGFGYHQEALIRAFYDLIDMERIKLG